MLKKVRVAIAIVGTLLVVFSGCGKNSEVSSFWTQRASSQEQITPAFIDSARRFLAAIRNERNSLNEQDQDFRSAESAMWKLRDDAGRQIKTHPIGTSTGGLTATHRKLVSVALLRKTRHRDPHFFRHSEPRWTPVATNLTEPSPQNQFEA